MKEKKENATIQAFKDKKGFIQLSLSFGDFDDINIKVCDFGGTKKSTAKKLTYAIYKALGGK